MSRRFLPLVMLAALLAVGLAWLALHDTSPAPAHVASTDVARAADVANDRTSSSAPATLEQPAEHVASTPIVAPPSESARTAARDDGGLTSDDLAGAHWVEGRVKFPDRVPLDERAFVVARGRDFPSKRPQRVPLGSDGRFRVAFSEKTQKGWIAIEARYLFLEKSFEVDPAAPAANIELAPKVGGLVVGHVVPSALASAHVDELRGKTATASGWSPDGGNPRTIVGRIDEALEFELGGLDHSMRWTIVVAPKGFAAARVEDPAIEVGKALKIEVPIVLAARIAGRVTDAAGAPIAGVSVRVSQLRGMSSDSSGDVRTKADGTFIDSNVRPGKVQIVAEKTGHLPRKLDVFDIEENGEHSGLEIALDAGHSIAGSVHWADGSPAAKATINVEELPKEHVSGEPWIMGDNAKTFHALADGTFDASGLGPGPYTLHAESKMRVEHPDAPIGERHTSIIGHADMEHVAGGRTDVALVLHPGSTVTGRVVDDLRGPVTKFHLEAQQTKKDQGYWNPSVRRSIHDEHGEFKLEGLADGEWEIRAQRDGGSSAHDVRAETSASSGVHVKLPEQESPLEIVCPRPVHLSGVVLDAAGSPVAGARLSVATNGQSIDRNGPLTDEHGNFAFESVLVGALDVSAEAEARAASEALRLDAAPGAELTGLVLRLRIGGTIVGQVLAQDGTPSSARTINVYGRGNQLTAHSDADGRFRFEHVAPGTSFLSVQPSSDEIEKLRTKSGDLPDDLWNKSGESRNVEIKDGETLTLVIGGTPRGRVHVEGIVRPGSPIAHAHVSFWPEKDAVSRHASEATSDDAGHYAVDLDHGGEYSASVALAGGSNVMRRVEVPDSAEARIDIVLPTGRIAGRVVDSRGDPVPRAEVYFEPSANGARDEAYFSGGISTANDGTFVAEGLRAATWRAVATPPTGSASNLAPARRDGIVLADGAHVDDVVLQLTEGASLQVLVVGVDAKPVTGASVQLLGDGISINPQSSWNRRTDASGGLRIDGLPSGRMRVAAGMSARSSRWSAPVETHAGSVTVATVTIEDGATLRVIVDDASGAARANQREYWIKLVDENGLTVPPDDSQQDWSQGMSDPRVFHAVPPGRWTASTADDTVKATVQLAAGASETVHLRP